MTIEGRGGPTVFSASLPFTFQVPIGPSGEEKRGVSHVPLPVAPYHEALDLREVSRKNL